MPDLKKDQKRVTISLKSVHCEDSEDALGGDEFYVFGGAGTGPSSGHKSKAILTKPIDIKSKTTRTLFGDEFVVFDDNVNVDDFVELGLEFRDQDFSEEDFDAKYLALVTALGTAVGAAVSAVATPVAGTIAGAILVAASAALVKLADTIDQDDILGVLRKTVNVADYPDGRTSIDFRFTDKKPMEERKGTFGYSDWDYTVTYAVDVGPAR